MAGGESAGTSAAGSIPGRFVALIRVSSLHLKILKRVLNHW